MKGSVQQASGSTAQVQEGLQYLLSAACTPRSNGGEPAREPRSGSQLGCFRGRSVQAATAITRMQPCGAAEARLPPHEYAELEKGAQENWPQHPDACSVRFLSPPFGRTIQASSASFLSQADMPLAPAFRLYDAFSAAVQRKCTCLVPRSLAGKGGLPLRLAFMGLIMVYTENPCNHSLGMI
jgi:hypothetical protein